MNLDRDLPDALRPLRGDPVADAARVLAALPPGAPGPLPSPEDPRSLPRRPWLPWALLLGGLLVGGAVGFGLRGDPGAVPAATDREQRAPDGDREQPAPDQPKEKAPDKQPSPAMPTRDEMARYLQVMAFGPIEIDEPGAGVQALEPGEWHTALATRFRTGNGQAGVYVYANDARERIDRDTDASIAPDRVQLGFGRLWVDTGDRGANVRVDCGEVRAALQEGTAAQFTHGPSGVEVLALRGTVGVVAGGATVMLERAQKVFVDVDRGPEPVEAVAFLPAATSWMTAMIEMSSDRRELDERVKTVVAAWEQGDHRDAARHELLKLGSRCVWLLSDSAALRAGRDPDYAAATADLILQLVDFRSARYALPLLLLDDVDLRLRVFRGIRDKTGTDGGTDESFWRDVSLERRRSAVEHWQEELSR